MRTSKEGQGQCGRGAGLVSLLPTPVPNSKRDFGWKGVSYTDLASSWQRGCCCGYFFRVAGLERVR